MSSTPASAPPDSAIPPLAAGLPHAQVQRIMGGLLPVMLLAAIDQTVVAIALLSIARDLDGLASMGWVISAYLVAATVSTPVYGKLSDRYGRRYTLAVSISICLLASIACTLVRTMDQLIVCRIVQGLGGGGLLVLAQSVIADAAPGARRGRYQGYMSGIFAFAAVFAPILGGVLTQWASWRAIFVLNVPIAALGLYTTQRVLRGMPETRREQPIDYLGILLLATSIGALMLAFTGVSQGAGWWTPRTLGWVGSALVLMVLFGWQQRHVEEPVLPGTLFTVPSVAPNVFINTAMFFVFIGCTVMLPLSLQTATPMSLADVGLQLMPYTLGGPAGSFLSGRLLARDGQFRRNILAGCAGTTVALLALIFVSGNMVPYYSLVIFMLGASIGFALPPVLVAIQSSVSSQQVGMATAVVAFTRTLGGAVGIAILTTVLLSQAESTGPVVRSLKEIEPALLDQGFHVSFGVCALLTLLATVVAYRLPRQPMAVRS